MVKLGFNDDTKMAVEADRFKMATRNDRAILEEYPTRHKRLFNANVRVRARLELAALVRAMEQKRFNGPQSERGSNVITIM